MEYPVSEMQQIYQEEQKEKVEHTEENDDSIKFQKFIYELFEKNGVLNDLRAHLRGHIIAVLKATGEKIPKCQKNFVQRLEYPFQALNMLIAEYLLRMNFNYSLSVFVSEMPLSNMAFDFAQSLLQLNPKDDVSNLTFKDSDIWTVLNFLGLQLDSEYALKIRNMYEHEEASLLQCLLKCITLASLQAIPKQATIKQTQTQILPELIPDDVSLTTSASARSTESKLSGRSKRRPYAHDKCTHYLFCKACRQRVTRLKDKYNLKMMGAEKIIQEKSLCNKEMEDFMKNISTLERNLISEIFSQMKTVYDAEVEMVKTEEQKKVKRSVGSLILQLRQKKAEMEEVYGARVEELERGMEEKKRFLWGLARGLRAQHENMARAMHRVRHETRRLTHKETLLKGQLLKAEDVIRKRGEQIRTQIAQELSLLAQHLDSVKKEKKLLEIERSELEKAESNYRLLKLSNADNNYEDLHARYDTLKTELDLLKKYIDTIRTDNKATSETSTNTEFAGFAAKEGVSLNNEQDVERGEERRAPHLLVNDLKKHKNVNFSQLQTRENLRSVGQSTSGDTPTQTLTRNDALEKEYQRLRDFASMQREQMELLTAQYSRLQSELEAAKSVISSLNALRARPQTAPPRLEPFYVTLHKASTSAALSGYGCGEQLTPLSDLAAQRILVPGDTLPFVGIIGEQHNVDSKKHLINQWRTLRHLSPVSKTRNGSPSLREEDHRLRTNSVHSKMNPNADDLESVLTKPKDARCALTVLRQREKSPKSLLREAKAKLRNKDVPKKHPRESSREKSPTAVLREAKQRLRKLEIEAEAVEKSYNDFRKKQSVSNSGSKLESGYSSPHHKMQNVKTIIESTQATRNCCEQIIKDYSDRYEAYFKNRNTGSVRTSPVPKEMANLDRANHLIGKIKNDYLNQPLDEFRKLYQTVDSESTTKLKEQKQEPTKQSAETITAVQHKRSNDLKEKFRNEQRDRESEDEILQQSINKIYNLEEPSTGDTKKEIVTIHQAEWNKFDMDSKHNGCDKIELKVSLVCEGDDEAEKPVKTKIHVDLNSGLMLECPTDTEVEVEDIEVKQENVNFDPNIPMKTTLLADVESFKQQDKSRQSPTSELFMFLESSVADKIEESSALEGSVAHETKLKTEHVLNKIPAAEQAVNEERRSRGRSPEQEANITRNDVLEGIYNSRHDDASNEGNGETDQDGSGDFADDFSADVDNYNVSTHIERSYAESPHSLPKSEENFWDS